MTDSASVELIGGRTMTPQILATARRVLVFSMETSEEDADSRNASQDHADGGFDLCPEADIELVVCIRWNSILSVAMPRKYVGG